MAKSFSLVKQPAFRILAVVALLGLTALWTVGVCAQSPEQNEAMVKVARQFIDVAKVKYEKGLYDSAEKMLLEVQAEYGEVMPADDAKEVSDLIGAIASAKAEIKDIQKSLDDSTSLIQDQKYALAIQELDKIKGSNFISEEQAQLLNQNMDQARSGYKVQQEQTKSLFSESVSCYKKGDYAKALDGFNSVKATGIYCSNWGRDCDYYINKCGECLAEAKPQPAIAQAPVQQQSQCDAKPDASFTPCEVVESKSQADVQECASSSSYVDVLESKRNRQRDYVKAVVNDAVSKAQCNIANEEFAKARQSLSVGYANIEKSKQLLGDNLYSQYKSDLDQLTVRIDQLNECKIQRDLQTERDQTQQLQQSIRENMDAKRESAVKEYLANALAFQKEQRYKEALAQINALLAIDPLNNTALAIKMTLEDTINWREQNQIQKEKYEQELKTLLESDRSSIPFADEMTFPKDWKEMTSRRKKDSENGRDLADMAIYRQLEQMVDLSSLTEDTTFVEAIEVISASVSPNLTIVVQWRDLSDNAYVEKDTPINLEMPGKVKLKSAISLVLGSVSGGLADIDYAVKDGMVQIATVEALPSKMEIHHYDVTELLGRSADFSFDMQTSELGQQGGGRGGGGGGGGRSGMDTTDDNRSSDERRTMASQRAQDIMDLIQDTVDPDSWYDAGGDGNITLYANRELIIRQTVDNHKEIERLLEQMRSSLGQQVAIEARFLIVTENFLQDLGIDVDFSVYAGSKWGNIGMIQSHSDNVSPVATGVPGSLAGFTPSVIGGNYGTILDDLQVTFVIRAIESHRNARTLNAPKVTVLSGESAAIRVITDKSYVSDFDFEEITSSGDGQPIRVIADPEIETLSDGVFLNVTPTISADKKYVLLNIETSFTTTGFSLYDIPGGQTDQLFRIQLPESEIADVRTRVKVPDGGTLLIGGQKLSSEIDRDEGVPVLSKIPLFGRLFENRSKIKDSNILLILVKPTIMLQNELEADATGCMK